MGLAPLKMKDCCFRGSCCVRTLGEGERGTSRAIWEVTVWCWYKSDGKWRVPARMLLELEGLGTEEQRTGFWCSRELREESRPGRRAAPSLRRRLLREAVRATCALTAFPCAVYKHRQVREDGRLCAAPGGREVRGGRLM